MLKTHYYREDNDFQEKISELLGKQHRITISKDIPQDTEVLILGYPSKDKLDSLPKLKALVIPFAGIPASTKELMKQYPDLKVYNIHHNHRVAAEMVIAMLLTGVKHIIPADKDFRKHDWSIRYGENPSLLLYQKKALICGYGHIGKLVAEFLKVFGVKVDYIRRNERDPSIGCYKLIDLPVIVEEYDFVINVLPATSETESVFNKQVFSKMKKSSFFVNIGRASTVDEQALYDVLKNKKILGAALDVWYNYPKTIEERSNTKPTNLPFHELDNLIMSPHRGGGLGMQENETFRLQELADLLQKIEKGDQVRAINLELGY